MERRTDLLRLRGVNSDMARRRRDYKLPRFTLLFSGRVERASSSVSSKNKSSVLLHDVRAECVTHDSR